MLQYLPEGCNETDVTDSIFDVEHLNKIIDLVGGKHIVRQSPQVSIPGRRVDNVGYTETGSVWIFEHQDKSGTLDQVHMDKGRGYGEQMSVDNRVEGVFILCENASDYFLAQARKIREHSIKRPVKHSHYNLHIVKSQWDGMNYVPQLFDGDVELKPTQSSTLDHYSEFVSIYGADWNIQREERNGAAITLWHRIPELDSRYMAWIHTLKGSIKVGLHCLAGATDSDVEFLTAIAPDGFTVRRAQGRATVEAQFDRDVDAETLANATETLKRNIRRKLLVG